MKFRIGVMGSSTEKGYVSIPSNVKKLSYQIGEEIAKNDCILVNGACPGVPLEASKGARKHKGLVIGITPAASLQEHTKKYKFPHKDFDLLIYTGFGYMGRNLINVANSDAIIVIKGSAGTLNEFSLAYDEGMVVGILKGSGGMADFIPKLEKQITRKHTGAKIITDSNPKKLVEKVIKELKKRKK